MTWLSLQTVAQIAIERILNALPEGFLIALFAWLLLRVLRRQNSGTRFAVWFLALLTVAALPAFNGLSGQSLMMAAKSWAIPSAMSSGSARPAISLPGSWALFVFLAWAVGASIAMLSLASGFWRLRQLRRSCTPLAATDFDPASRKTVDSILASSLVRIAASEHVRVPAAIGFWKRTIVLPPWALRELPPEDLNVILLHEFAHLRRGDDWTNLVQKFVRALFFFHPAVWWIENRLSVEREMACDDAVLAETANPRGYATCLVSLLEKSLAHRRGLRQDTPLASPLADHGRSLAQAAVDRAHEASLRLARILDINRPMATRVWKPALAMAGVFSLVCLLALPLAPHFVAFDRGLKNGMSYDHSGYDSAAVSQPALQSSLQTAIVIPAALRVNPPSVAVPAKTTTAEVTHADLHPRHGAGNLRAPTRAVAAQWNSVAPLDRLVAVSEFEDQEIVPEFRTLVFVEATPYMTSGATVWNVQVWRVTLVSAFHERLVRVPVANSI
jgi:beta-lactamase regulating signal transducer with metallopeptidase domain